MLFVPAIQWKYSRSERSPIHPPAKMQHRRARYQKTHSPLASPPQNPTQIPFTKNQTPKHSSPSPLPPSPPKMATNLPISQPLSTPPVPPVTPPPPADHNCLIGSPWAPFQPIERFVPFAVCGVPSCQAEAPYWNSLGGVTMKCPKCRISYWDYMDSVSSIIPPTSPSSLDLRAWTDEELG